MIVSCPFLAGHHDSIEEFFILNRLKLGLGVYVEHDFVYFICIEIWRPINQRYFWLRLSFNWRGFLWKGAQFTKQPGFCHFFILGARASMPDLLLLFGLFLDYFGWRLEHFFRFLWWLTLNFVLRALRNLISLLFFITLLSLSSEDDRSVDIVDYFDLVCGGIKQDYFVFGNGKHLWASELTGDDVGRGDDASDQFFFFLAEFHKNFLRA